MVHDIIGRSSKLSKDIKLTQTKKILKHFFFKKKQTNHIVNGGKQTNYLSEMKNFKFCSGFQSTPPPAPAQNRWTVDSGQKIGHWPVDKKLDSSGQKIGHWTVDSGQKIEQWTVRKKLIKFYYML